MAGAISTVSPSTTCDTVTVASTSAAGLAFSANPGETLGGVVAFAGSDLVFEVGDVILADVCSTAADSVVVSGVAAFS